MARQPKPWFRKSRDCWCVELDGKQVVLARGKGSEAEARAAFHELMANRHRGRDTLPRPTGLLAGDVCDLYYAHAQRRLAADTVARYEQFLASFVRRCGRIRAADLRPADVSAWWESQPGWNDTTRRNAAVAVSRAFRWAFRQGHLPADPLVGLEKPAASRREAVPGPDAVAAILGAAASPEVRDLLTVIVETGCRPGEAARLEARHVDWDRRLVVLAEHKTRGRTDRPRVVVLSERAATLLAEYAERYPHGPLLRNGLGRPWTRNAMACAMRRIRERTGLGPEATANALRHRFATDALLRGVPIATVAALLGHRSTAMLERHYGHLTDHVDHLRDALDAVRPDVTSPADGSPAAGGPASAPEGPAPGFPPGTARDRRPRRPR